MLPALADQSLQAPVLELHRGSDEGINRQKFPFRTPIEIDIKGKMLTGLAYFDLEPEFPCFALILGIEQAIVLRKREADDCYTRIGWAWLPDIENDEDIIVSTAELFEEDESVSAMDQSVQRHPWAMVTIL